MLVGAQEPLVYSHNKRPHRLLNEQAYLVSLTEAALARGQFQLPLLGPPEALDSASQSQAVLPVPEAAQVSSGPTPTSLSHVAFRFKLCVLLLQRLSSVWWCSWPAFCPRLMVFMDFTLQFLLLISPICSTHIGIN